MATLQKPRLLLLDEHTAALDPKTAAKVLDATERIVGKDHLTTLMITHNMKDAIAYGDRLIMMYDGRIVIDVSGEEKKKLTVRPPCWSADPPGPGPGSSAFPGIPPARNG